MKNVRSTFSVDDTTFGGGDLQLTLMTQNLQVEVVTLNSIIDVV